MGACFPLPAELPPISGPAQRVELRSHNVLASGVLSIQGGFLEFIEADGRTLRWETQNLREFSCDRSHFLFTASQLCQHPGSYVFRTPRARTYFKSINTSISPTTQQQSLGASVPPRAAYDQVNENDRERGRQIFESQGTTSTPTTAQVIRHHAYNNVSEAPSARPATNHFSTGASVDPTQGAIESPPHTTPLSSGSDGAEETTTLNDLHQERMSAFHSDAQPTTAQREQTTSGARTRIYNTISDVTTNRGQVPSPHGSASPSRPCPLESAGTRATNGGDSYGNGNGNGNTPPILSALSASAAGGTGVSRAS